MNFVEMEILVPGNSLSFRGGFFGFSVVALLKHPELGPILFDTGHHSTRHLLLDGLARVGLKCSDVRHVFLSHLHFDHINNVELFPDATFHVSQTEWDYAKAPHPQDLFGSPAICAWLKTRDLRFIGESGELAQGLRFRHAPGHTPGMTLLAFKSADGKRVIIAGDACKTYRELATGDAGESYDFEQRGKETLRWIRQNADVIVCGHHPVLYQNDGLWAWESPSNLELIVR